MIPVEAGVRPSWSWVQRGRAWFHRPRPWFPYCDGEPPPPLCGPSEALQFCGFPGRTSAQACPRVPSPIWKWLLRPDSGPAGNRQGTRPSPGRG